MAGGRPKKPFKEEYSQMLEDHMAQGLSFQSFGGVIKCCKETLERWDSEIVEFASARKRGETASMLFWERIGMAGTTGKLKNFNATSWIFNMRNRFGWRNDPDEVKAQPIEIKIIHPNGN